MPLTRIKLTAFADGGISTAKLADNSITIDKLNNNLSLGGNDAGGTPFTITLPQGVGGTDWSTYAPITRSSSGATGNGYEVAKSTGYYIDTSAGTVTIKLPASANRGDYISLVDYKGTNSLTATDSSGFYQNRIQINPNGHKINGVQQFTDIGSPKGGAQLVYVNADTGWVVTDTANEDTAKALVASTPRINVNGILNGNSQAYFQDTNDPAAGRQITISGSGFLTGATITMIDSASNSYPSGSSITPDSIADNQIVFTVPASVITAAKASGGSFDDRFDVKVTNSNGSFVLVADALQYAPRPNFELSADTNLGTVSHANNTISGTSYATYDTLTFGAANNNIILATSLDADDTITYSITSNGGLTNLAINSASGALTGTPASLPSADQTQNYTVEITATATTKNNEDSTEPTVTFARNFVITLEGEVSAPTITSVTHSSNSYFSSDGQSMIIAGTGFQGTPTIKITAADGTEFDNITPSNVDGFTGLTFQIPAGLVAKGQIGGDERFNIRVTNPNTRALGYGKFVDSTDAFEYFGAAPTITAGSNIGTLAPGAAGTVDYTSLGASFTITTLDPDDTIQLDSNGDVLVSISNNSDLPGLGVSVTGKTVTLTGTNSSDITVAGNKTFQINVTTLSDYGGSSRTATTNTGTITITIASSSSGPGYTSNIQNSLYFDGSPYLSRSLSSTAITTATISMWVKGSGSSTNDYLFRSDDQDGLNWIQGTDGRIYMHDGGTGGYGERYRDYSSWYHIVLQNNSNTARFWINNFAGTTDGSTVATVTSFNFKTTLYIGAYGTTSPNFNGYMANIHFVDGQALSPDYFAKTDTATGSWIPKEYDGTSSTGGANATGANPSNAAGYDTLYGTYGFHIDFRASSLVYSGSSLTTVNDVSGRTTPNNVTAN